jgi:hypothetical protein
VNLLLELRSARLSAVDGDVPVCESDLDYALTVGLTQRIGTFMLFGVCSQLTQYALVSRDSSVLGRVFVAALVASVTMPCDV